MFLKGLKTLQYTCWASSGRHELTIWCLKRRSFFLVCFFFQERRPAPLVALLLIQSEVRRGGSLLVDSFLQKLEGVVSGLTEERTETRRKTSEVRSSVSHSTAANHILSLAMVPGGQREWQRQLQLVRRRTEKNNNPFFSKQILHHCQPPWANTFTRSP